ncbi:hypothetical protein [Natrinema marinum]|uniref:hypothetical protein n=1 Tax=Natrinema marinum TaxID=2961598 RepID=UPI0020C8D2ED|nr:hypothetical protein [Natrinema marinum]
MTRRSTSTRSLEKRIRELEQTERDWNITVSHICVDDAGNRPEIADYEILNESAFGSGGGTITIRRAIPDATAGDSNDVTDGDDDDE